MIPALLALLALAPAQSLRRTEASQQLDRVRALRTALLRQPAAERTAAAYQGIISLLPPLWQNAKDPAAAAARFEAASLYVALARDQQDEKAYTPAAQILLELLSISPYSSYRRNAEFALAQIELYHTHDRSGARFWLRDFAHRYPADPRIGVAEEELRGRRIPEPEYMVAADPLPPLPSAAPPTPVLAAPAPAAPPPAAPDADAATARSRQWKVSIGNITGVQVFTTEAGTSVVLALRRQAHFSRGSLPRHQLVYFDVSSHGSSARQASGSARLHVGDGRVLSIHIAEYRPGVTRVVIQTKPGIHADRGGFFPNPDRLIIGLRGGTALRATPASVR